MKQYINTQQYRVEHSSIMHIRDSTKIQEEVSFFENWPSPKGLQRHNHVIHLLDQDVTGSGIFVSESAPLHQLFNTSQTQCTCMAVLHACIMYVVS